MRNAMHAAKGKLYLLNGHPKANMLVLARSGLSVYFKQRFIARSLVLIDFPRCEGIHFISAGFIVFGVLLIHFCARGLCSFVISSAISRCSA